MSASSQHRGGWANVAELMGCKPEMAVFRRFRKLNYLRLLEMQSHLAKKEEEYEGWRSLYANCPATQSYQVNWEELDKSLDGETPDQVHAWREVREMLPQYSKNILIMISYRHLALTIWKDRALLEQVELCKQENASKHDFKLLLHWLASSRGNRSCLRGPGCDVWNTNHGEDTNAHNDFLVLSSKHGNRDRFERWAGDTFLSLYHRLLGQRLKVSLLSTLLVYTHQLRGPW